MNSPSISRRFFGLAVLALLVLGRHGMLSAGPQRGLNDVHLTSLKPKCHLEVEGDLDSGRVWLDCKCDRTLVADRSSLARHVEVKTASQALELVRLFSGAEREHLFTEFGEVEVEPASQGGWFQLEEKKFKRCCVAAQVVEVTGQEVRSFRVKRTLFVAITKSLYEVTEVVTEDGLVVVTERRLLTEDPRSLGMTF